MWHPLAKSNGPVRMCDGEGDMVSFGLGASAYYPHQPTILATITVVAQYVIHLLIYFLKFLLYIHFI